MKTKKINKNKLSAIFFSFVMLFSTIISATILTFSLWVGNTQNQSVITENFNASEDDFTFYAAIPNIATEGGYDYYPTDSVPKRLENQIVGLAVARYEAFNKTVYVPSYPKITIGETSYNGTNEKKLPVIHVLKGYYSTGDFSGNNGIAGNDSIEYLILPSTVNYVYKGAFSKMKSLKSVTILGTTTYSYTYTIPSDVNDFELKSMDGTNTSVDRLVFSDNNTSSNKNDDAFVSKNNLVTYAVTYLDSGERQITYSSKGVRVQPNNSLVKYPDATISYNDKIYIEDGAFTQDNSSTPIPITSENTIYTFSVSHKVSFIWQDVYHCANTYHYKYNNDNLLFDQFDGIMRYEGSSNSYYTYITPKEDIDIFTIYDNTSNNSSQGINFINASLKKNTRYKIIYSSSDSTSGSGFSYEYVKYQLQYNAGGNNETYVDLELNPNQDKYEEYTTRVTLGDVFPVAQVNEIITYSTGTSNTNSKIATFDFSITDAKYSEDVKTYLVTFSPDRVYQSTHYSSKQDTHNNSYLKAEVVQNRLNAEKIYYLNEVIKKNDDSQENEKITISFKNPSNWSACYVLAYSVPDSTKGYIYYDGKSEATNEKKYCLMTKDGDNFTYSFDITYGTPMYVSFVQGEASSISEYPDYIDEEEVTAEKSETRYVYFQNIPSDNYTDKETDGYVRYAAYSFGSKENWVDFEMVQQTTDYAIYRAAIPYDNTGFIICRMNGSTTENVWDNVWNQSEDITVGSNDYFVFTEWISNTNKFSVSGSNKYPFFDNSNSVILKLENYGFSNNTVYTTLNENINFGNKDYTGTSGNYDFEFTNKNNQTGISLPKGTVLSLGYYDSVKKTYVYPSSFNETGTSASFQLYRILGEGTSSDIQKIEILRDCKVDFYFELRFDAETKEITYYKVWIQYQQGSFDDITFADAKFDESAASSANIFTVSSDGDNLDTEKDESLIGELVDISGNSYYQYVLEEKNKNLITGSLTSISYTNRDVVYCDIENILSDSKLKDNSFRIRAKVYASSRLNNNELYVHYVDGLKLDNGKYIFDLSGITIGSSGNPFDSVFSLSEANRNLVFQIYSPVNLAVIYECDAIQNLYGTSNNFSRGQLFVVNSISNDKLNTSSSTNYGTLQNAINNNYFSIDLDRIYINIDSFFRDSYSINVQRYTDTLGTVNNGDLVGLKFDEDKNSYYFDRIYENNGTETTSNSFKLVFTTFSYKITKPDIYIVNSYELTRNASNSTYEEYFYNGEIEKSSSDSYFVVSNIDTLGKVSSDFKYYGTTGTDNALGLIKLGDKSNFLLFTPNDSCSYDKVTYDIYDESDTKIGSLYYDEKKSDANGFQTFVGEIPVTGSSNTYFYVKSSGSNPTLIGYFLLTSDGNYRYVSATESAVVSGGNRFLIFGTSSNTGSLDVTLSDKIYATVKDDSSTDDNMIYEYYLVGNFNNWRVNNEYALTFDQSRSSSSSTGNFYYIIKGVYLTSDAYFKISGGSYLVSLTDLTNLESNTGITISKDSSDRLYIAKEGYYDITLHYYYSGGGWSSSSEYHIGIKENTTSYNTIDLYFKQPTEWTNVHYRLWNDSKITNVPTTEGEMKQITQNSLNGEYNWYTAEFQYHVSDVLPNKIYFYTIGNDKTIYTKTNDLDFDISNGAITSGSLFFTPTLVNGTVASQSTREIYFDLSEENLKPKEYRYVALLTGENKEKEYIELTEVENQDGIYKINYEYNYKTLVLKAVSRTTSNYDSDAIYRTDEITIDNKDFYYINIASGTSLTYEGYNARYYLNMSNIELANNETLVAKLASSNGTLNTTVSLSNYEENYYSYINYDPKTYTNMTINIRVITGQNEIKDTVLGSTFTSDNQNNIIVISSSTSTLSGTYDSYNKFVYSDSTPYLYYLRTNENWSINRYGLIYDKTCDKFICEGVTFNSGVSIKLYDYNGNSYVISTNIAGMTYDTSDPSALQIVTSNRYRVITSITTNKVESILDLYTTTSYFMTSDNFYNSTSMEVRDSNNNLTSVYTMTQSKNVTNYYIDAYIASGSKITIYNAHESAGLAKTYSQTISTSGYYRVYYCSTGNMSTSKKSESSNWTNWKDPYIYVELRKAMKISFSPSAFFNGAYINTDETEVDTSSLESQFNINIVEQENTYYIASGDISTSTLFPMTWDTTSDSGKENSISIYTQIFTTSKFNEEIKIYNSNKVEIDSIEIAFPGTYVISYCGKAIYRSSASKDLVKVNAERIQGETKYFLKIGDVTYDELTNTYNGEYDEFAMDSRLSLSSNINLSEKPIYVVDGNDNIVTEISSITLQDYRLVVDRSSYDPNVTYYTYSEGDYHVASLNGSFVDFDTTKYYTYSIYDTSSLSAGVYEISYSIDNRRRKEDKYFVFTYLLLKRIPSSSIRLFYYQDPTFDEDETYYASEVYTRLDSSITSFDSNKTYYEVTKASELDPNETYYVLNEFNLFDEVKVNVFKQGVNYYHLVEATKYEEGKTYYTKLYSEVNITKFEEGVSYFEYVKATNYDENVSYYEKDSNGNYNLVIPELLNKDTTYYIMKPIDEDSKFEEGKTYYTFDNITKKYNPSSDLKVKDNLLHASSISNSNNYVSKTFYKYDSSKDEYVSSELTIGVTNDGYEYFTIVTSLIDSKEDLDSALLEGNSTVSSDGSSLDFEDITIGNDDNNLPYYSLNKDNSFNTIGGFSSQTQDTFYYENESGKLEIAEKSTFLEKQNIKQYSTSNSYNSSTVTVNSSSQEDLYVKSGNSYLPTDNVNVVAKTYYLQDHTDSFNTVGGYNSAIASNKNIYKNQALTQLFTSSDNLVINQTLYERIKAINSSSNEASDGASGTAIISLYDAYQYNSNINFHSAKVYTKQNNQFTLSNYSLQYRTLTWTGYKYYDVSQGSDISYFTTTYYLSIGNSRKSISVTSDDAKNYYIEVELGSYVSNAYVFRDVNGEAYDSSKTYYSSDSGSGTVINSSNITVQTLYTKGYTEVSSVNLTNNTTTYYVVDSTQKDGYKLKEDNSFNISGTYYTISKLDTIYDATKEYLTLGNDSSSYVIVENNNVEFEKTYYTNLIKETGNKYDSNKNYYHLVNNAYEIDNDVKFNGKYYIVKKETGNTYSTSLNNKYYYSKDNKLYKVGTEGVNFDATYYYDFTNCGSNEVFNASKTYFKSNNGKFTLVTNVSDIIDISEGYYILDQVVAGGSKYLTIYDESTLGYCVKEDNSYKLVEIDKSVISNYYIVQKASKYEEGHSYFINNNYYTRVDDLDETKFNSEEGTKYYVLESVSTYGDIYYVNNTYFTSSTNGKVLTDIEIKLNDTYYNITKISDTTVDSSKIYAYEVTTDLGIKNVSKDEYSQPYKGNYTLGYYGLYEQFVEAGSTTTLKPYQTLSVSAPEGMMFSHWNTKLDGTGTSYSNGEALSIADGSQLTLYPMFKEATYNVYISVGQGFTLLDENGSNLTNTTRGKDEDLKFKVKINEGYDLSLSKITVRIEGLKGNTLVTLSPSNTTDSSRIYGDYVISHSIVKEDCRIIVEVEPLVYQVTLESEYGTIQNPKFNVTYGTYFNIEVPTLSETESNQSFIGWYYGDVKITNASGSLLSVWNIPSDVTLTARFKETNAFIVKSVDNHGNIISTSTQSYAFGETVKFSVNKSLAGYTYNSFSAMYDQSQQQLTGFSGYNNVYSITLNDETHKGEDVIVTISYTLNVYTITYSLEGGVFEDDVTYPTSYTYIDPSFTIPNPVREGYEFIGWSGTNITLLKNVRINTNSTGDRYYVANWKAYEYNISYNYVIDNEDLISSISNPNPSTYSIENNIIELENPTLENYTFVGWYLNKELTQTISSFDYTSGNITLYGYFQPTIGIFVDLNEVRDDYTEDNYDFVLRFSNSKGSYYLTCINDSKEEHVGTNSMIYYSSLPRSEFNMVTILVASKEDWNAFKNKDMYIQSYDSSIFTQLGEEYNACKTGTTHSTNDSTILTTFDLNLAIVKKNQESTSIILSTMFLNVNTYNGTNYLGSVLSSHTLLQSERENYALYKLKGNKLSESKYYETGNSDYSSSLAIIKDVGTYLIRIDTRVTYDSNTYEIFKLILVGVNYAEFDMSEVTLNDAIYVKDGGPKEIRLSSTLPAGLNVEYIYTSIEGSELTSLPKDSGTYFVKAVFSCDDENYKVPDDLEATLIIYDKDKSLYSYNNASGKTESIYFGVYVNGKIRVIMTQNESLSNVYYYPNLYLKEGNRVEIKDSNYTSYLTYTNSEITNNTAFLVPNDDKYSFSINCENTLVSVTYESSVSSYVDYYLYSGSSQIGQFRNDTSFSQTGEQTNQYLIKATLYGGQIISIRGKNTTISVWDNYEELGISQNSDSLLVEFEGEYTFYLHVYQNGTITIQAVIPDTPVYVTVYEGFNDVHMHYWNDGFSTSWPGVEMSEIVSMRTSNTKTYTALIPTNMNYLIFNNNNNGLQTANLPYSFKSRKNYYIVTNDNGSVEVSNIEWLHYTKNKNVYTLLSTINPNSSLSNEIKEIKVTSEVEGSVEYDSVNQKITVLKLNNIVTDLSTLENEIFGTTTFTITLIYGDDSTHTFTLTYEATGEINAPILISSSEDFLNTVYNEDYASYQEKLYFYQTCDFDDNDIIESKDISEKYKLYLYSDEEFLSNGIYSLKTPFNHSYEGNNHSISFNAIQNKNGLFAVVGVDGEVRDINLSFRFFNYNDNVASDTNTGFNTFKNSSLPSYYGGAICGLNNGLIDGVNVSTDENLTNKNFHDIVTWAVNYFGGIAGYNKGTISNSNNNVRYHFYDYSNNYPMINGGIAGYNEGNIISCNSVSVVYKAYSKTQNQVGYLVGYNAGTVSDDSTYIGTDVPALNRIGSNTNKIRLKIIDEWIYDYTKLDETDYYSLGKIIVASYDSSDNMLTHNIYSVLNSDMTSLEVDVAVGASYIVISKNTDKAGQTIYGSFDSQSNPTSIASGYTAKIESTDLNSLITNNKNVYACYVTSGNNKANIYCINENRISSDVDYATVIDKTQTFTNDVQMKVYSYDSENNVIAIDIYDVIDFTTEIKIYNLTSSIKIAPFINKEYEENQEEQIINVDKIDTVILYITSSTSYSWGYDGSLESTEITINDYVKSTYSKSETVTITYYDDNENIITVSQYHPNNKFTIRLFDKTTKFVISEKTSSNVEVEILIDTIKNGSSLNYWYSTSSTNYVWIENEANKLDNSLNVTNYYYSYHDYSLLAIYYDSNNSPIKVTTLNQLNSSNPIPLYENATKVIISQISEYGLIQSTEIDLTQDVNKYTLNIINITDTKSYLSVGVHALWVSKDNDNDSNLKSITLFNEISEFDGFRMLVYSFDENNNLNYIKYYVYSEGTYKYDIKIPNTYSRLEVSSLDSSGNTNHIASITNETETNILVLDNSYMLSWQGENYIPVIANVKMINQIYALKDGSEITIKYYKNVDGNAELITSKIYNISSTNLIDVYYETIFFDIVFEIDGEEKQIRVKDISTVSILFLAVDKNNNYKGVWGASPNISSVSIIPIINELSSFSSYSVYYYNNNDILISVFKYTINNSYIDFLEDTSRIVIRAVDDKTSIEREYKINTFDLSKSLHFVYGGSNGTNIIWGDNKEVDGDSYKLEIQNSIESWGSSGALTKVYYFNNDQIQTIKTYTSYEDMYIDIYESTTSIRICRLVDKIYESSQITINSIQKDRILKLSQTGIGQISVSWIIKNVEETETRYLYLDISGVSTTWGEENNKYTIYYYSSSENGFIDLEYDKISTYYRVSWDLLIQHNPENIQFACFDSSVTSYSYQNAKYLTYSVTFSSLDITKNNVYSLRDRSDDSSLFAGSFKDDFYQEYVEVYLYVAKAYAWDSYYVTCYKENSLTSDSASFEMKYDISKRAYSAKVYYLYKDNLVFSNNPKQIFRIQTPLITGYSETSPYYALYSIEYVNSKDESGTIDYSSGNWEVDGEWLSDVDLSKDKKDYTSPWYLIGSFNSWKLSDSDFALIRIEGKGTGTNDTISTDTSTYETIYYYGVLELSSDAEVKIVSSKGWDCSYGSRYNETNTWYRADLSGDNLKLSVGSYLVVFEVSIAEVTQNAQNNVVEGCPLGSIHIIKC